MILIETPLKDLYILEPQIFKDERGYFFESYNQVKFKNLGLNLNFVQDNQSFSKYGVIRGLHYQLNPHAQTKLVRALKGKIFDVAVDIRKKSPTFGKWYGVELSDQNLRQLLIPKGFAHGFSVLSDSASVLYKCDYPWTKEAERGLMYNDTDLKIDWKIPTKDIVLSCKDQVFPDLEDAEINF